MPLADGQLLACVNPPISSIDESCFALLDADSGESSLLCALPAHKAYAGFALDGECTVETFVQELTRIVQMMTLENGVSS